MKSSAERLVKDFFVPADVIINGDRPWDIQVCNDRFFNRVLTGGSLALGEAYVAGWWECEALDCFFDRILKYQVDQLTKRSLRMCWCRFKTALAMSTGWFPAFAIGHCHYDIGNDFFSLMLDKWMNYSCAYWKNADDLDKAQEAKMDLICRKLKLEPGLNVLDIGCGWGGLAAYMARKHDVSVTGITVSKEQANLARERCKHLPVDIQLMDYRKMNETFDRIVSVGMFEHVGVGNYRTFMKTARRCLAPQGLFLLHSIAGNSSKRSCDPWISKYIFPNSMIPSGAQITSAAEQLLVIEDWHSFGPDYDPTLMAWHQNFIKNWDRIRQRYDQRFFRMWTYYLLACAGSFRSRRNQLWQIVFSKDGFLPGYDSVR